MALMTLHEPATAGLSPSRAPAAPTPTLATLSPRSPRRRWRQLAPAGLPNSGAPALHPNPHSLADGTAAQGPHQQQGPWRAPPQQSLMLGQPSSNLQDICSLQLGLLQLLLQKSSSTPHQLRAAVYVRTPGRDATAGHVCLRRVAATPAGAPRQQQPGQDGWSIGAQGSLHADGDVIMLQLAEECLVNEEMLLLPNSGALVLPLVDIARGARTLVGMLLVEPSRTTQQTTTQQHAAGASFDSDTAQPFATAQQRSAGGGIDSEDHLECSTEGLTGRHGRGRSLSSLDQASHQNQGPQQQQQQMLMPATQQLVGSVSATQSEASESCCGTLTMPLADGHFITPEPQLGWPSWVGTYPGFTDDELLALRATAPVLAKACAMDLVNTAATLQGAAANTRAAVAASIVQQARKPMAAVNSMSAMLLPRLEEGSPDRDFVRNIRVQGERLQELLRQLDAALAPRSTPLAAPGHNYPMTLTGQPTHANTWPVLQQSVVQHREPAASHKPAATHSSAASQQQQTGVGLSPQRQGPVWAPGGHPGSLKVYADMEIAGQPSDLTTQQASNQQVSYQSAAGVHQQVLTAQQPSQQVSGQLAGVRNQQVTAMTGSHQPSPQQRPNQQAQQPQVQSPQHATTQTSMQAPAAKFALQEASAGATAAASDAMADESNRTFTMRLTPADIAADGVIDLEVVDVLDASEQGRNQAVQFSTGGTLAAPPNRPARAWHGSAPKPRANVISTLVNVLTAAARLAKASGVYFAVHHPLQTAHPTDTGSTSSGHTINNSHSTPVMASHPITLPGMASDSGHGMQQVATKPVVPALQPRPSRPLYAAVQAGIIARIVAYVVDLALQCTPRGGSVGISASQLNSWVELVVSHTGQLVVQRFHAKPSTLHTLSAPIASPNHKPQRTSSGQTSNRAVTSGRAATAPAAGQLADAGLATAVPATNRTAAATGATALPRPAVLPGSGLLSFGMAEELVAAVGGTITSTYPVRMHHAVTGTMELATKVVIRLPAAH